MMTMQSIVFVVLLMHTVLAFRVNASPSKTGIARQDNHRLMMKILTSLNNYKSEPGLENEDNPIDKTDEILLKNLRIDSIPRITHIVDANSKPNVIDPLSEGKRFYSDWKRRK